MLTVNHTFTGLPFITAAESGVVTAVPALRYCQLYFDSSQYHDDLPAQLIPHYPPDRSRAVVKRRAEYLAGRYAAHLLLQDAGCLLPVLTGSQREPLWPDGWSGSLSHAENSAIVLLAPAHAGLTPGVDIERARPEVFLETAAMFTSDEERRLLEQCDMPYDRALQTAFSAKESVYKALFPQVQRFFGFEAARIIQLDQQQISLQLTQSLTAQLPAGYTLTVEYAFRDNDVITLLY